MHPFLFLLHSVAAVVAAAVILVITQTLHLGISPMPSSRKVRRTVLEALSDLPRARGSWTSAQAGAGSSPGSRARERPDLTVEGFERELPRDVRLVSAVFAVRGWTPAQSIPVPDMHRSRVYVYELE